MQQILAVDLKPMRLVVLLYEVSSHGIIKKRETEGWCLKVLFSTNLSPCHLDYHKTLPRVTGDAKKRLLLIGYQKKKAFRTHQY